MQATFCLRKCYIHINTKIEKNLSKLNLIGTSFCVLNRQVFGLYRLNKQRLLKLVFYFRLFGFQIL
jgi:hypothetical protein